VYVFGDIVHERAVVGRPQLVGGEVLRLADEVHGETAHRLTTFAQLLGGQCGQRA
jgi:hypothetical protein